MSRLSWTFSLNTPEFVLKSTNTVQAYKIEITNMQILLKNITLFPSVLMQLEKQLATESMKYPMTHFYTKEVTIPESGAGSRQQIFPIFSPLLSCLIWLWLLLSVRIDM